jgi:hypothetical protein
MTMVWRVGMAGVAALLLPACNLTYIPDQTLPPSGSSGPPFGLFLPLDGAMNVITNPQFGWYALDGATSYRLQIATDVNFTEIVWDDPTLTVTSTILTAATLTNFTTFYWRIYGIVPGSPDILAGGSPFSFRTDGGGSTFPSAFTTQSPTGGAMGVPLSPLFAWHPSAAADSYTIEVELYPGSFTGTLITQSNIHVNRGTLSVPLDQGKQYHWRVHAFGQLGDTYSSDAPIFITGP